MFDRTNWECAGLYAREGESLLNAKKNNGGLGELSSPGGGSGDLPLWGRCHEVTEGVDRQTGAPEENPSSAPKQGADGCGVLA